MSCVGSLKLDRGDGGQGQGEEDEDQEGEQGGEEVVLGRGGTGECVN